jgi:sigma-B regulation protein RsbU (phosphoserine phosphatase)
MKLFIQVVIAIGLIIAVAGIGFFGATGSASKLILYSNVVAAAALVVLLVVVAVPGLSRKLLILPNRAVVAAGTLIFAIEALYYTLSFVFHYQTWRITGSLGLAVLLFSFGYVAVQIALTSERRLVSIENELSIAREMQASILPSDNPELKNLRVAALYRPMTDIAGDFYDFIPVDPNRTGFLVADVTGHGIPAALVSSMIKVAMQSVLPSAHDPQEVLRELNRILCVQLRTRLVSAAYLWLDTENRIALYSAAGHPPLVLWRAGQFERIESNGLLLGVFPDADYPLHKMPIQSGDRLLLYTDGVSEPENANRDAFGDHKLEQVVRDNQSRPPAEFLNQILSAIHNWQPPSTPQHDDITMVAIDVV